jgi:hypothetical protein
MPSALAHFFNLHYKLLFSIQVKVGLASCTAIHTGQAGGPGCCTDCKLRCNSDTHRARAVRAPGRDTQCFTTNYHLLTSYLFIYYLFTIDSVIGPSNSE